VISEASLTVSGGKMTAGEDDAGAKTTGKAGKGGKKRKADVADSEDDGEGEIEAAPAAKKTRGKKLGRTAPKTAKAGKAGKAAKSKEVVDEEGDDDEEMPAQTLVEAVKEESGEETD
jgi:hypothetical protein